MADVQGAHLDRALLRGTGLHGALFRNVNLNGADLHEAMTGLTIFAEVDLSTALGLDTVHTRRRFSDYSVT